MQPPSLLTLTSRPGAQLRAHAVRWGWALLAAVGLLAGCVGVTRMFGSAPPVSAPAPLAAGSGLGALQALPMPARGAISTALGASRPANAAQRSGAGFRLRGGDLSAQVHGGQVRFGSSRGAASMTLSGVGRGTRLEHVASGTLSAQRNRVVDAAPGLTSWYAAGPLGVEQGFTITRRPMLSAGPSADGGSAGGGLTVALRLSGSLRARRVGGTLELVTRSGAVALRYGGLRALDARGRSLPSSLVLHGQTVLLQVVDRGAQYPIRIDPFVQQGAKIDHPTGDSSSVGEFGSSATISADGSTVLVGGWPNNSNTGGTWIFSDAGGTWSLQQYLPPPADASGSAPEFGFSVAVAANGNTALIGGPGDNSDAGATWVFTRSGTTWTEQQKLTGSSGDQFGSSVALSGDGTSALIASPDDSGTDGDVEAFSRSGTTWTEYDAFNRASYGAVSFGSSLAMSADGSTALVGDDAANGENGVAWIFTLTGQSWNEQAELTPASGVTSGAYDGVAEFGSAAALAANGDTALVGAAGAATGATSVFTRSGTTWSQQALLVPSDEVNYDSGDLGGGLALSADGNTALVGLTGAESASGATWVFGRGGTSWVQEQAALTPSDSVDGSAFGTAVALSSDGASAVISGAGDDLDAGAAWSFTDAPTVTTSAASGVDASDGTLNGTLAAGPANSAFFQYGTSTGYGSQTAAQATASSGAATPVSATLSGLTPETTYHYRLVAENSAGTTDGADATFTTPAIPATTPVAPVTTTATVSSPPPTTRTTTLTVDDQTLKLVSPALALCTAVTGKLKLSLSAKQLTKGTKLTFSSALVYLDRGVAHRKRERARGRLKTVTIYTANATVKRLPKSLALSVKGLKAGTHTARVVVVLTHTVVVQHHRRTVRVNRTLRTTFRVC